MRVKLLAHFTIEGQRDGFPLTFTRARACGDLPSVRHNFVIASGRELRVWVSFTFLLLLLYYYLVLDDYCN